MSGIGLDENHKVTETMILAFAVNFGVCHDYCHVQHFCQNP